MTTISDNQSITASGGLVELGFQTTDRTNVAVSGTSTSNATELVSTSVVCDGSPILVEYQCAANITSGEYLLFGVWVDGTYNVTLEGTMSSPGRNPFSSWARITPAAGARTISIRWWKWQGSTSTSYIEGNCRVRVSKIVQATQWPAIVTGVVTCTSTTRPAAPVTGQQILEVDTGQQYYWDGSAWRGITVLNYNAQTGTTYTFVMADGSGQMVTLSNASAITATIPLNASVPFPVGTVLNFMQTGAGQVTVSGAVGTTINTYSAKNKTAGQYASGSAMKTATDTWVLFGNLA